VPAPPLAIYGLNLDESAREALSNGESMSAGGHFLSA
jgi:hypothetical protein